jgi:hypothetical protein
LESRDDFSRLYERRRSELDRRDDYRLGFGKPIAADRHETGDGSSRGSAADSVDIGVLRLSPPRGPFRDHTKASAKAQLLESHPLAPGGTSQRRAAGLTSLRQPIESAASPRLLIARADLAWELSNFGWPFPSFPGRGEEGILGPIVAAQVLLVVP